MCVCVFCYFSCHKKRREDIKSHMNVRIGVSKTVTRCAAQLGGKGRRLGFGRRKRWEACSTDSVTRLGVELSLFCEETNESRGGCEKKNSSSFF